MDKLKQNRDAINAKINALIAKDSPTAEDNAELEKLEAEYEANEKRIKAQQRQADREAQAKADADAEATRQAMLDREQERLNRINSVKGRKTDQDSQANGGLGGTTTKETATGSFEETDETVTITFGESADAVRQKSYRAQCKQNANTLRSMGYVPRGEFTSFADYIRAGLDSNGGPRFKDRLEKHCSSLLDSRGNFLQPQAAVSGMSEGVASDGGYFVVPEYGGRIVDRVYSNPLWGRTDNYSVSGNSMTFLANAETSRANGSRTGGLRGYWLGEGASITSSKPTHREVQLKLKKLGIVVYLTNELIADGGAALESYVVNKAAEEFNFMIGDSLINGTGAGQPLGVLNCPSLLSIAKESGQAATTLAKENFDKMYARFYMPNMSRAFWYHHQDIEPQLDAMSMTIGSGGVPVYTPPGGTSAAPYGTIKGRPKEPTEFNATLGTQGDVILADLKQILSISKGGVGQAVSMHIQFLTDQLAIRFTMRLDAGPWETAAITPYKGSNTQSSFVTLDTRS